MWLKQLGKIMRWSTLYFLLMLLAVYQSHDPHVLIQKAKTIFQYQQF